MPLPCGPSVRQCTRMPHLVRASVRDSGGRKALAPLGPSLHPHTRPSIHDEPGCAYRHCGPAQCSERQGMATPARTCSAAAPLPCTPRRPSRPSQGEPHPPRPRRCSTEAPAVSVCVKLVHTYPHRACVSSLCKLTRSAGGRAACLSPACTRTRTRTSTSTSASAQLAPA